MPAPPGFTLLEVLMALAILGLALVVLLEGHHTALRLNQELTEEIVMRQLSESVVARAEVGVLSGNFSDSGDFGNRYPGYSWSFEAFEASDDELVLLYSVDVSVRGPEEERTLTFYVYDLGAADAETDSSRPGGLFSGGSRTGQGRLFSGGSPTGQSGQSRRSGLTNQQRRISGSKQPAMRNQSGRSNSMFDDF